MRFSKRRIAALASLSILGLVWTGCEAKEQSEYIAGVSTQVKVPRDLTFVRLSVSVGGVRTFCRAYRVYDGRVQLPRSLGTFAQNDPKQSGVITYQIIGYTKPLNDGDELDDFACGDKVGETDGARILRRSRQPYIENEILFLPMPLKYSCFDVPCSDDQTCKGGTCVDATTDPTSLKKYTPDLVDGTGGTCFSLPLCLGAALPAIPVNLDTCTFAIPNTPSAPATIMGLPNPFQQPPGTPPPGEGINVEITYDGGYVTEVLDKDPDEGFTVPDATKPQQFKLAPGLCSLFKGVDGQGKPTLRRITAVRSSPTCQPKTLSQPICQGDAFVQMGLTPDGVSTSSGEAANCSATALNPPSSGLQVVIDDSFEHASFFKEEEAVQLAIKLAMADPAFYRAQLGLIYASGTNAPACGPTGQTAVPLGAATTVAKPIGDNIAAHLPVVEGRPADSLPRLDLGLATAYADLQAGDFYRRAVIVIGEREFDGAVCSAGGNAIAKATAAKANVKSVDTYVFDIAGLKAPPAPPIEADQLAAAGGTGQAFDGRNDKAVAKDGLQKVLERLATCVYDPPSKADQLTNDDKLAYSSPAFPSIVSVIDHNDGCTVDGPGGPAGWGRNVDGKIVLCGSACTDYQTTLKNSALLTLPFGQPAPAVPVFAHKAACAPKKP